MVRMSSIHRGNLGVDPDPAPSSISGPVTALTAADPDHNPGIRPQGHDRKSPYSDLALIFPESGPGLPQHDGLSPP